jgi:serpin B
VSLSLLLLAGVGAAAPAEVRSESVFATQIYRRLAAGERNVFLSPFSISTVLAMAAEGARGETARQMSVALGGGPDRLSEAIGPLVGRLNAPGKRYEISIANALWVDQAFPLAPPYLDRVQKRYGGGLFEVDFRTGAEPSRQKINAWIEQQTRDRIKDLVPAGAVNSMTRLVLTNAIYFKGRWSVPFDERGTRPQPFRRVSGRPSDVPMMRNGQLNAQFAQFQGFKALELAYQGGELSMVVLLPDDVRGLARLEKRLTPELIAFWIGQMHLKSVDVWLPRFKLETSYELEPALSALGMPLAFDAAKADFTGMAPSAIGDRLHLSAVLHKAFVEVNEKGTEAAAATGGIMSSTSISVTEKAEFHADHPFLFLIRERASGAILFMGRVMDPAR